MTSTVTYNTVAQGHCTTTFSQSPGENVPEKRRWAHVGHTQFAYLFRLIFTLTPTDL